MSACRLSPVTGSSLSTATSRDPNQCPIYPSCMLCSRTSEHRRMYSTKRFSTLPLHQEEKKNSRNEASCTQHCSHNGHVLIAVSGRINEADQHTRDENSCRDPIIGSHDRAHRLLNAKYNLTENDVPITSKQVTTLHFGNESNAAYESHP